MSAKQRPKALAAVTQDKDKMGKREPLQLNITFALSVIES